ncbi:hypothetical protein [Bacillus sp. JJ722]|uniref:hypothetical protein n=1 Tax=Bacillus sp. JJ722 TaxID=3122973 RepID=UPI002FFFE353
MKTQKTIICPKCHSHEVKKLPNFPLVMFALAFATVWIPMVGWIISIALLIIGVIDLLKDGVRMKCLRCEENFRVSKESFRKYKEERKRKSHA